MNELGKYQNICIIVFISVLLLLILTKSTYNTHLMNFPTSLYEGYGGDEGCDPDDMRDKINKIYDMTKKYKRNTPRSMTDTIKKGPYGVFEYRDEHYDSDDGWDSETEELKKICSKMKDNITFSNYQKEVQNIMNEGSNGDDGFF
jgi:hypothetical protein